VVAVELDRRLLPSLRVAAPRAEIVNEDVLNVDPAVLFPRGGEIVVGNIPYYLTGALVPHARVTGQSGDDTAAGLLRLGVEPTRRAETLSLAEWEMIFRHVGGPSFREVTKLS
jgi:16S rRNA A1518/A1519 N6-dimethyltransferase RsmA/KsgA/DIM1 with predicted DNA glycosylase/AP lyase activity